MKEKKDKQFKSYMMTYMVLIVVAFVLIVGALIKTQAIDGDLWREKAADRTHDRRPVKAMRGNIYSTDGKILASTVSVCDLYIDMGRLPKKDQKGRKMHDSEGNPIVEPLIADSSYAKHVDEVCQKLASVTDRPASFFRGKMDAERAKAKPSRCFRVCRAIPLSTWLDICKTPGWRRAIVKQVDDRSVIRQVRAHTYGNMAENVIGFRNSWESETYTGLEGYYNDTLRGVDGMYQYRRLTKGVWIEEDGHRFSTADIDTAGGREVKEVVNGCDIISTIDTRYQDIAENSLRRVLNRFGGKSGCAILMEMETGYVLACSSLTRDSSGRYLELPNANVACSDIYEPGSTFKTVVLMAMMNDTTIDTAERVRIGQKHFPVTNGDISDDRAHNQVDTASVAMVMAKSSNVGMSELGWKYYRNQRNRLRQEVEQIFPYDILNLDLRTGEYKGHINDLNASGRDFLNFCYGYSTNVSPLQMLTFYNAIGAGGRMVKPLFCRAIVRGNKQSQIKPVVLKEQICSPQTAAIMKDLLVGVVDHGTGDNIKNNTYGIAGKTGTAIHNYEGSTRYNASFAGFFPAESPKYSCLVLIQDVGGYGRNAAVVFKDIADCVVAIDKSLGNISLEKKQEQAGFDEHRYEVGVTKARQDDLMRAYGMLQMPYVSEDSASYWVAWQPAVDSLNTQGRYVSYQVSAERVPNCLGMTVRDAMMLLRSAGMEVRFSGYGRVVRQDPRPNTKVGKGTTTVYLRLE